MRAGCAREGTTFALLRHYADAQGVAIAVPPAAPEGLKNTTRAECLAACAANHSCQRFRVASADGEGEDDADEGACELRVDPEQGERDGDVIGAGIYNNKCWVPGC